MRRRWKRTRGEAAVVGPGRTVTTTGVVDDAPSGLGQHPARGPGLSRRLTAKLVEPAPVFNSAGASFARASPTSSTVRSIIRVYSSTSSTCAGSIG